MRITYDEPEISRNGRTSYQNIIFKGSIIGVLRSNYENSLSPVVDEYLLSVPDTIDNRKIKHFVDDEWECLVLQFDALLSLVAYINKVKKSIVRG